MLALYPSRVCSNALLDDTQTHYLRDELDARDAASSRANLTLTLIKRTNGYGERDRVRHPKQPIVRFGQQQEPRQESRNRHPSNRGHANHEGTLARPRGVLDTEVGANSATRHSKDTTNNSAYRADVHIIPRVV